MLALEITAQLLIEHAGSDLQQMVGTRWGPPHLLFIWTPPDVQGFFQCDDQTDEAAGLYPACFASRSLRALMVSADPGSADFQRKNTR